MAVDALATRSLLFSFFGMINLLMVSGWVGVACNLWYDARLLFYDNKQTSLWCSL